MEVIVVDVRMIKVDVLGWVGESCLAGDLAALGCVVYLDAGSIGRPNCFFNISSLSVVA